MRAKPEAGTRVRLTGDFLRSTGQVAGGEGQSRWDVVACSCGLCGCGPFVAVNQPNIEGTGPRHFNYRNLERSR